MILSLENLLIVKGLWMIRFVRIVTRSYPMLTLIASAALYVGASWIGKSTTYLMKEDKPMHKNLVREIIQDLDTAEKIEKLLPADSHRGFTIISAAVDKYSLRVGMGSREVWKMLYSVAMAVHDEQGDYKGE